MIYSLLPANGFRQSPDLNEIIDYSYTISQKENIDLSLDQLAYIIQQYNGDIKNVLWRFDLYKLNYIYIDEIKNLFKIIQENLNILNIDFSYDSYVDELELYNRENKFILKNINRYIIKFSKLLFDEIIGKIKTYLPDNTKNTYFTSPETFINNITKSNFKKISYKNADKKLKIETLIFNIKTAYHQILTHIKLLDPILSKDKSLNELYSLIKKCDLKYIDEIRNIIFNLLITNIKGSDIVKYLLEIIINDEKLYSNKKIKIIEVCKDTEYGIIKGRREINQFDNLIVSIINILTSYN